MCRTSYEPTVVTYLRFTCTAWSFGQTLKISDRKDLGLVHIRPWVPLMLASLNMESMLKVPTVEPQETNKIYLISNKVKSWILCKIFTWLVLRVGSSFLPNPTLNTSSERHLPKVLPCGHPSHNRDLGLETLCKPAASKSQHGGKVPISEPRQTIKIWYIPIIYYILIKIESSLLYAREHKNYFKKLNLKKNSWDNVESRM